MQTNLVFLKESDKGRKNSWGRITNNYKKKQRKKERKTCLEFKIT